MVIESTDSSRHLRYITTDVKVTLNPKHHTSYQIKELLTNCKLFTVYTSGF